MALTANSQNFSLTGLRALVTGGGSGIGKVIADAMSLAGARVVVCDVNDTMKPNYVCDVSKSSDVDAMFAAIQRDLGGLDILVNNVGVPGPTARVDEMDADAYDECVRVNLGGISLHQGGRADVVKDSWFDHKYFDERRHIWLSVAVAICRGEVGHYRPDKIMGNGTWRRRCACQRNLSGFGEWPANGRCDRARGKGARR